MTRRKKLNMTYTLSLMTYKLFRKKNVLKYGALIRARRLLLKYRKEASQETIHNTLQKRNHVT